MDGNSFSKRLKELRLKNRVTQKELGEFLGFGYTTISNYEKGRNEPSIDILIKLADFFNVTLEYLIGVEGKKPCALIYLSDVELACAVEKLQMLNVRYRKAVIEIIDVLFKNK